MFETVEELNEPIPAQITGRKKERAKCVFLFFLFLGGILLLFQSLQVSTGQQHGSSILSTSDHRSVGIPAKLFCRRTST